jgi:sortase A
MAVKKKRNPEDLSIDELRQLIINKRRAERSERSERLAYFRQTGRTVALKNGSGRNPRVNEAEKYESDGEYEVRPRRKRNRTFLDNVLVGIEILAVAGLVFISINVYKSLKTLNNEVAASIIQPTLTPTAIIQAVVLPSGHTPPNDPGGVRFNESEIPEHLRAYVQAQANIPIPTSSPEQAIRIQIPAISVDAPIVMGDGEEQLKKGVGHHIGSPNPGQSGNMILSAHNDVFGEIFRDLDQLESGDEIIIYTQVRSYTYIVQQQQVVEPTQVEVMAPTTEAVITLISCYPYMVDNQRIVISASLLSQ